MKIGAALYIEDMGTGNTMTESIDMESKLNNKHYPDWVLDCANFVSQCLDAGKKVIENGFFMVQNLIILRKCALEKV